MIKECLSTKFSKCHFLQKDKRRKSFKLSEDEKNDVLKNYLRQDKDIKPQPGCQIGVGYNSCTDINFKASELIKLLEPQILEIEK